MSMRRAKRLYLECEPLVFQAIELAALATIDTYSAICAFRPTSV